MLSIIFRGHDEAGFFAHALGLRRGPSPVRVLPGNQRTSGERYACLIVVKDYVRMGADSRAAGHWHYSDIEPAILTDVREGRAILVFDLTNEGPAYDPTLFDPLYAWLESHRIPPRRCFWLSQNRMMSDAATAHAGPRAAFVLFANYDYFLKLMAWQLSSAADSSHTAAANNLEPIFDVERKDKLLLCLNATPRLSRMLTVAALHHHLLLNRSLVSFPGLHYVKTGARLPEVLAFLDRHPRLEYLRPWIHAISQMSALKVDDFQEQGNALVEKIDRGAYNRTFFSLVTESDFAEKGIARVTEKTIKAFSMGHPTLILGNPHSIDIVRGFGFQDWIGVFDRAAESLTDPAARFEAVLAEVLRQAQRIKANTQAWVDAVRDVSMHNHHYASSGAFLARYVDEYDQALVSHMSNLVAG